MQDTRVVKRVVTKTQTIAETYNEFLGSDENILSHNKVTGYSVNFPIYSTCQPTHVCAATCYYAKGASSWPASLKKQLRAMNSCKRDYRAFADKIILEHDKHKMNFIRWNGGGDLFKESVEAINYIGRSRPDIRIWVVTRLSDMAKEIEYAPNVYIHFSID